MLSVVYIEIWNIDSDYRTLEIQKPGNIEQSVENMGVCASISALRKHHKTVNSSEVAEHSFFNLATIT